MKLPVEVMGLLLAFFGGAASYLHKWLQGERFILAKLLASSFIGGFTGLLGGLFAMTIFPDGSPLIHVAYGASGALGYETIRPLLDRVLFRGETQKEV